MERRPKRDEDTRLPTSGDESITAASAVERALARASHRLGWPSTGVTLSRYVLRRRLGYGGMGQVWAAWDGELAREVAIKVVRLRDAANASVSAERLAREARALARLSDPHVVQVYDVGSYDTADADGERFHGIFVVMELVRGPTVADWLAASRRSVEEIVRVFVEAGRGLAAAHAVGLLHRDVKPSNVFVDDAPPGALGRVRVGDFGLARAVASSGSGFATRAISRPSDDDLANDETLSGSLTDTGTVVGTPLYMAPEQHVGALLDARSDQYSFCLALYEALSGVRAFTGHDAALLRAKWMRALELPTRDDASPALREIVYRGLAPEPAERWPDMAALVAALERAIRPRPRRAWMYAGAGAIAIASVVGLAMPDGRDARCDPIADSLWNDERRSAFEARGSSAPLVSRYVAEIDALQHELCRDGAAAHEPELQCLRRVAREIDGVVALFENPTEQRTDVVRIFEGVPEVESCRHARADPAGTIDERDRLVVEAQLGKLARGDVLWRSERHHEALVVAEAVLAAVDEGRVPPDHVRAPAMLLVGKALEGLGSTTEAETALGDAFFAAQAQNDAATAFEASRVLVGLLAEQQRVHDAETWLRHGEVEVARLPADPVLQARLVNARAAALTYAGDLEGAVLEFRRGLDACPAATCGAGSSLALNLASVLWRLGERDEPQRLRRLALDAIESRHGAESPASIQTRLDLVHGLIQTGRIDEADAELRIAEPSIERWLDPAHYFRVLALDQRAEILLLRGDPAGAVALNEKSLALVERTMAPDDLRRVSRLNDLGYAYFASGRGPEALAVYERARELVNRVDPSSIEAGALLVTSGYVKGELGDVEGALADLREGRRVLQGHFGDEHPHLVQADENEARVLRLADQAAPPH